MGITVCIPTLPTRAHLLTRALRSVQAQTLRPDAVVVVEDTEGRGAAHTRNRALERVETDLVAFLDDDDEFLPLHLQELTDLQRISGADLVYPWFEVFGDRDPLGAFGQPFDPVGIRTANYVPVTVLARTSSIRAAGGFRNKYDTGPSCEDWNCWLSMLDNGCHFVHLPLRTWVWHREGQGTGGIVNPSLQWPILQLRLE